jgi:hypothetical protein
MFKLYNSTAVKSFIFFFCFFISGLSATANNYYVTTASDTGTGSLRAAIDSANANPGMDSIVLQLSVQDTIYLQSILPQIEDSLVITGLPCQNPTISGALGMFNGSIFHSTVANVPLTVNYLNMIGLVDTTANATGAAIRAHLLYVNNCFFEGDEAVPNTGSGKGGAIYTVNGWILNSTFSNNGASNVSNTGGHGGALAASGIVNIFNCTFNSNYAAGTGGAIGYDSAVIGNCTIANNLAAIAGGAMYGTDSISLTNSIVWNNNSSDTIGGLFCSAPVVSAGCNVIQAASTNYNFSVSSTDVVGTDPMLDTLGYYNGCVPVIPIFCGSVAQNHASCTGATTTDAQGIPAYGIRDAGAFEIVPPSIGGDTIDSIQPGTTADLLSLFNTQGLTCKFYGNFTDSTQVDTGTYTIIAINYLGCSDTATAIIRFGIDTSMVDTTGIKNLSANAGGISLFPNPADSKVNVRITQASIGPWVVKMFDATGRAVMLQNEVGTVNSFSIDISALNEGLYFVQVTDAAGNCMNAGLSVVAR